jgi:peroxisomal 2,4-dienoyl-CoA reductase
VQLNTPAVVAKAGVDALSGQIAIELGPRGITSNVIAPGMIERTEGTLRLVKEGEEGRARSSIPTGRLGTLRDVADATVYLFSDPGSYVNGATLIGECISRAILIEPRLIHNNIS